jgi:mannose-6-phosphate isomerase-like protein (cupin superfamily)
MVRIGDGALVLAPGEGRNIDLGGFKVAVYAEDGTTDGAFSLIETIEADAGGGPPMHIHRDCAESFFVLDGAYQMFIDQQAFDCPAGSFIYVPRGIPHTFKTLVAGSRKLNVYTPAGMVGYFDELAASLTAGMDEANLDAIAARYEMEVVGPVPHGYLADDTTSA